MRKKRKVGIIFILAFLFVFLISVVLERQNTKTDISDDVVEEKREDTDGIYMEGRIPSLERQQNFLGECSVMENIEHYIVYDNDLYGITSEGKAVLADMYRENEEIDGRKTIVVQDNVNGYPVTEIMEDAMSAFWTEELQLPSTLQKMGAEALGGFFLSSVTMPENLEIREAYRSEINDEGDKVPKKTHISTWCGGMMSQNEERMIIINDYLYYWDSKDEVLRIPEEVKVIAQGALNDCPAQTVILPEGIQKIYSIPEGVKNMNMPESVMRIVLKEEERNSPWFQDKVRQAQNGMVIINGILLYSGAGTEKVIVPEGVWSLSGTFQGQEQLKEVILPESVTEIGMYSFADCHNLSALVLPEGVIEIGQNAFEGCSSLPQITLGKSVRKIGRFAFSYCTSLEDITLPEEIREIPSGCFDSCRALRAVTIPDKVKGIGFSAFGDCTSLESLVLSDALQYIGSCAFENCISLKSIEMPESLEFLGEFAFMNCHALRYIKMGNNVKYAGDQIFQYHELMDTAVQEADKEDSDVLPIMEEVVVELPELIPERIADEYSRNKVKDGSEWFYDNFGLDNRLNMVFIVQQGSSAEQSVREYQTKDGKEMYQYQYYE